MKFIRRRLEEPEIGLAPLIDVVFLLLIFFMLTTSFVPQAGFSVSLPEASAPAREARALPEVVIDAEGRIVVAGQVVAPAGVEAALKALETDLQTEGRALRIRADGGARHQRVVTVMDAAAAAGFTRIDIATRPVDPAH